MKISGIIIAKNEEKLIADAIKSIKWCDEILVFDSGSTDKTVTVAKKLGASVTETSGKNFADWRNNTLKKIAGDWYFYVDADERVTPGLKEEIQSVVQDSRYSWYAIPRKNIILGQEFKHGEQWPDYVKRLFKKEALKGWKGEVHEEPIVEGEMGHLKNPLTHLKHEDFSEMIDKTNLWSEIEAKLMFEAKHPPMTIPRFLSAIAREFWKRMILQLAFLDGPKGIMYAMYQVFSKFISYTKLWELQLKAGKVK